MHVLYNFCDLQAKLKQEKKNTFQHKAQVLLSTTAVLLRYNE